MTDLDFKPLAGTYYEILLKARGYGAERAQKDIRLGRADLADAFPDDNLGRLMCQAYDLREAELFPNEPGDPGDRAIEVLMAYLDTLNLVRLGLGQPACPVTELHRYLPMTAGIAADEAEIAVMRTALSRRIGDDD